MWANKLTIWWQAIRPKTLAAVIVPVLLAALLSYSSTGTLQLTRLLCILCFGLGIQISTNLINDLYDFIKGADTVNRKGPRRVIQAGLVSIKNIKIAIILILIITLLFGLKLIQIGGSPIAFLVFISIIFSFAYTAGPYPIAYLGLGEIFVFIFFGPIACATSFYLLTNELDSTAILLGTCVGLISTAMLIANNLRDYEEDKQANKNTLVVRFGKNFGKAEYLFSLIIAALVPFIITTKNPSHPYSFIAAGFIVFAIPSIKLIFKSQTLAPLLGQTGKLLIIFAGLFTIGWLI